MKAIIGSQKGVSLVELVVVLVILTIGIIPIAAVQTRSNRDVFKSGQRTEALNIAQMQMEQARALGFNNAVSDSGQVGVYNWQTTVANRSDRLNEIVVDVQWQEQGTQRTATLRGLVSDRN